MENGEWKIDVTIFCCVGEMCIRDSGKDTVTENGTTFERYILSKMDKTTSGENSTAEDSYTVKYYRCV